MYCSNCGTKQNDKSIFCHECGASLLVDEDGKKTEINSKKTIFTRHSLPINKSSWGIGRIILILIVLLIIGSGIYNSLDDDSIAKNNEGLSSFDSGDGQTAISQFQQAKRDAVSNEDKIIILKNLAYAYISEGQNEEALDTFKEALNLIKANSFDYYLVSGEIELLEFKIDSAIISFNKAHEINPTDYQINNSIALFYLDLEEIAPQYEDYSKALIYAKKAYEYDTEKNETTKQNLALAYYFNEDFKQTIELLSTTNLVQHPNAAYWLGLAYLNEEDYINAKINFEKAKNGGVELEKEILDFLNEQSLTYENDGYEESFFELFNPWIEPVGYFSNPDVYDSDTITDDKWFSYVKYYENDEIYNDFKSITTQLPNQRGVLRSVVKIVCEDQDYFYTGSGVNFDKSGYILTNLHVVDDADRCMIGFPDPDSGLIKEIYWATIIIDAEDATGHDLAYLSIEDPVFDDEYNIYGYYNNIFESSFPCFEVKEECYDTPTQLGDSLFVIGYPDLSGVALTITDGLVSSLYSPSGYIITSAKINSGNSGGLAIDKNGCYIGVPTAVYYEDGEELFGEIIDAEFVDEFNDAISDDLDVYNESL
jgi:tetratricopeptide (TPR) repeat protein